jgi:hypothetical protein
LEVDLLSEFGHAELGVIEQFQPDRPLQIQAAAHELHAGLVERLFIHQDRLAVIGNGIWRFLLFQRRHYGGGILGVHIRKQHLVVRAFQPPEQGGRHSHRQHHTADEQSPAAERRTRPKPTYKIDHLSLSIQTHLRCLNLHAHDFLVSLQDFVSHLHKQLELHAGLFHPQHHLMQIAGLSGSHIGQQRADALFALFHLGQHALEPGYRIHTCRGRRQGKIA